MGLDLKSLIILLTEYEVHHIPRATIQKKYTRLFNEWGLTKHHPLGGFIDTQEKRVYIISDNTVPIKVEAVIHEFMHAHYYRKGKIKKAHDEEFIEDKTQKLYAELFE